MMYHTVRIRDLEPQPPVTGAERKSSRSKSETSTITDSFWGKSIKKSIEFNSYDYCDGDDDYDDYTEYLDRKKYRQIYFEANGPHTHLVHGSHALFEAYFAAYNAHEDIVLSPDDIWLMITIYYSRYVDGNAEQMRHLFVNHEGKKELVVEIMAMEPDWPQFLIQMRSEIGAHVKNNVVDLLTSNFSTTGSVESFLSSACIMRTFNKYFRYTQKVCGCGIRNVHFMGTLDDWKLLRKKAEELKMFILPSQSHYSSHRDFGVYLDGVLPILDQFIRTYEGDVDNDFWDTIFDYTKVGVYGPSGINRRKVDGLRGWFLRLCYGYHLPSDSDGAVLNKIKLDAVSVPVKLIELPKDGKESSCYIVGGFHAIHSSKDGKHRPIMSFSVFQEEDGK